jgi:uncharacterized protein
MRKDALAGAIAFLAMLSSTGYAQMTEQTSSKAPAIQVTGTGSVQAKPDMATIGVGVTTEDANAQNAVAKNSAAAAKVISELEAAGVEEKDLQTSNFSVYPNYRNDSTGRQQPVTFRASNTVTVTIRDLGKAGEILNRAVGAGSNQINGPQFSVSQPEKYLNEARKKAVENAMAKAATYAGAAGLKLGAVLSIAEGGGAPSPVYNHRGMVFAASAAPPPPVEAGEETLSASVSLVIELKP